MRGNALKFTVSVDAAILAKVERRRKASGETRSALVARALTELLRNEARASAVSRYLEAYTQFPETSDDVELARDLAKRSLAHLPWDDA